MKYITKQVVSYSDGTDMTIEYTAPLEQSNEISMDETPQTIEDSVVEAAPVEVVPEVVETPVEETPVVAETPVEPTPEVLDPSVETPVAEVAPEIINENI